MNRFSTITALAFAGMLAIAPGAQAGGLYDNDGDRATSDYDRKSPSIDGGHDNGATSDYNRKSPSIDGVYDYGAASQYNQQSAGSNEDDDHGAASQYDQPHPNGHCDDDDCPPHGKGNYQQNSYNGSYTAGRCAALVRAVGKRNVVLGFARNSARFAWTREARFVHGDQYANWGRARDAHISCTLVGALNSCEATATPCH